MLFNSYPFLFVFLPTALLGYEIAAHWHRRAVVIWLSFVSLAFYAYWRPPYLLLLCASIGLNYFAGSLISRRIPNRIHTGLILAAAIFVNLAALCYFKYLFPLLHFFADITHSAHQWGDVLLPLGISFFTFTQIAYLVDLQQGTVRHQDLGSYTLFATFFPHLIAGPILHHGEMMPQFQQLRDYRLRADDLAIGFSWFTMGLFKKVLLADKFSSAADSAFAHAGSLTALGAWAGVLSYALQLYFDFSGYSDMALGLARMFSIDFPLNFSSPYKARSIIDFWQRWHITLTRYINVYLYNPIAVWVSRQRVAHGRKISRKAMATPAGFLSMIAFPTLVALFLAGVWHGAGMQFIIFGLLHALYLTINHAWRLRRGGNKASARQPSQMTNLLLVVGSTLLTFAAVLVGQVFFRASSVAAANSVLAGMLGLHHPLASAGVQGVEIYRPSAGRLASILVGFVIVWAFPNTQQILARFKPALELTKSDLEGNWLHAFWRPSLSWGVALGLLFFVTVIKMQDPSSFLYFQF